jgi:hypothetical protein
MPEFRKLFDLPAVKLSREDIENIGRLITDGLPIKPKAFNFSLSDGDTTYRAYSLDELLSQNLPSSIDDLSFSVHGWSDEYKIDRGITISLRRTIASCQIHALDEVWFKGKIQQIMEFFERRKPWYGNTRPSLAGIFGGFQMLSLYALLFLLWKKEFLFSLFAGFTFAAIIKGFNAFLKGRLFPLVDIQLTEKPRQLDRETLMVIFTALGALATIAGVIIQVLQKSNS